MNKQEKIILLKDLVNIDSTNGNDKEVLVSLIKKTGKVLGFSGHMDVVDAGDSKAWETPPFQATEIDGKLFGRGSTDMKSGLATIVIAMIEIEQEGTLVDGQIKLLATVGEEIEEVGAAQLTKLGYADDLNGLIIGNPSVHQIIYVHKGLMNYTVVSYGKKAHNSMLKPGINVIDNLLLFTPKWDNM